MDIENKITEIEKDIKILTSMIADVQITTIYIKNILEGQGIKNRFLDLNKNG